MLKEEDGLRARGKGGKQKREKTEDELERWLISAEGVLRKKCQCTEENCDQVTKIPDPR